MVMAIGEDGGSLLSSPLGSDIWQAVRIWGPSPAILWLKSSKVREKCWELQSSLLFTGCVCFTAVLFCWCFRPSELSLEWQHLSYPLLSVTGVFSCGPFTHTASALRHRVNEWGADLRNPPVLSSSWWMTEGSYSSPVSLTIAWNQKPFKERVSEQQGNFQHYNGPWGEFFQKTGKLGHTLRRSPQRIVESHMHSCFSGSTCFYEGRDSIKGATCHHLKGVEVSEPDPEMLFNFIPVTCSSSGTLVTTFLNGSSAAPGWLTAAMEDGKPKYPRKTLALKLLALLSEIVMVIVNHTEKKDKSILV